MEECFASGVRQVVIADIAALSTVHVSRVLHALQAARLITLNRGAAAVPQPAPLIAFAGFDLATCTSRSRRAVETGAQRRGYDATRFPGPDRTGISATRREPDPTCSESARDSLSARRRAPARHPRRQELSHDLASIMVAVDLGAEARDRVRLAGHLADDFRARLIGVAAEEASYAVPPIGPVPASAYALAANSELILNDLKRAHAVFEEAVGTRSRVEWHSNLDFPLPFLIGQAAAADLVVVGRKPASGPLLCSVDPGDLVMHLGRPVLVVPPGLDHLDVRRVAVGWKNTREARRAVRDALPFLTRAFSRRRGLDRRRRERGRHGRRRRVPAGP